MAILNPAEIKIVCQKLSDCGCKEGQFSTIKQNNNQVISHEKSLKWAK
jgi:hypothetical protein